MRHLACNAIERDHHLARVVRTFWAPSTSKLLGLIPRADPEDYALLGPGNTTLDHRPRMRLGRRYVNTCAKSALVSRPRGAVRHRRGGHRCQHLRCPLDRTGRPTAHVPPPVATGQRHGPRFAKLRQSLLIWRGAPLFPNGNQSGPEIWVTDVGSSSRRDWLLVAPLSAIVLLAKNRTQTVTSRSLVERHSRPSTGMS